MATSLNNLGMLYRALGQYTAAEPLCQRALAIREKALGPDHPEVARVLYNLGRLHSEQKQLAETESMFKRALDIYARAAKINPLRVAETISEYAKLLRATGRPAEAVKLEVRARTLTDQQEQVQK